MVKVNPLLHMLYQTLIHSTFPLYRRTRSTFVCVTERTCWASFVSMACSPCKAATTASAVQTCLVSFGGIAGDAPLIVDLAL